MQRRSFLRLSSALPALAATTCRSADRRPNVLWILAEDFSPDLGCYGNGLVRTPNLDRLAAEGVRYTQCICTAPVCSAARSALMTGMFQTSIGAHNHRSFRDRPRNLPAGIETVTDLFRRAGYFTANCRAPAPGLRVGGKTDFNFSVEDPFDGDDWNERPEGSPFYAQINFPETHRKFRRFDQAPVNPDEVPLPAFYPDHPVVREDIALYFDTAQHLDVKVGKVIQRLKEEGLYDETIIFFFGDHGQALHRGKQWLYEQGIRIPLIVRVPEQFQPPGYEPGSFDDQLLQHIDITATSLHLAGETSPDPMQGRIFIGPDAEPEPDYVFSARDRCDETVDRIRCIRDRRWKLIRNFLPDRSYSQKNHYKDTSYPVLQVMRQLHQSGQLAGAAALWMAPTRPEYELYDLQSDPDEVNNLADSSEHAEILARLQERLAGWIEESNDHGRELEDPLPAEYDLRTMVAGWYTNNGLLSDSESGLRLEWTGQGRRPQEVVVPWIEQGGALRLELELRSDQAQDLKVRWGNPAQMGGLGEADVSLAGGTSWRTVAVDIDCEGWLTWFAVGFPAGENVAFCRQAKLSRRGEPGVLKEWRFA